MNRPHLLLGIVIFCALSAGCLQLGAPGTPTETSSSPTLTPMPSPESPQMLNQTTAVEYVRQSEHQLRYNDHLDENTAELTLNCSARPISAVDNGYYVVAGCFGTERTVPPSNASHGGAVSDIGPTPVTYFVNETTIERIDYETQKADQPTQTPPDDRISNARHLYISNFNQSAVKYNVTIVDVTNETPAQHSQYARTLDSHKGRKIVRVVEQTGTYRITVQIEQEEETYTWHVGSESKVNGISISISPDGAVKIESQPRL